jgi:hypothetical protein
MHGIAYLFYLTSIGSLVPTRLVVFIWLYVEAPRCVSSDFQSKLVGLARTSAPLKAPPALNMVYIDRHKVVVCILVAIPMGEGEGRGLGRVHHLVVV